MENTVLLDLGSMCRKSFILYKSKGVDQGSCLVVHHALPDAEENDPLLNIDYILSAGTILPNLMQFLGSHNAI